jgi:YidC/Oxa1 family membrane protein insertase
MAVLNLILIPFGLLLKGLYTLTANYGLAIILYGLIFKVLLFPISMKGRKGMLDMSRLSERQKELQTKFGTDRQAYSVALQELYASENVKASSGCLWSFLPMPVLMALYFIVSNPFTQLLKLDKEQVATLTTKLVELVPALSPKGNVPSQLATAQSAFEHFGEIQTSLPDIAAQITAAGGPIDFRFFGLNLSAVPDLFFFRSAEGFSLAGFGLFLLPIISAAFALLSMMVNLKINRRILGTATQQDKTNRQMLFMQPLISLWLGFTLPAALGLYWTANSVFAIAQEFVSIGTLRRYIENNKIASQKRALEAKEKEKERKLQVAEAKKQKAEEARRIKLERKVSTDGIAESRSGMRAYARGRTYDAARYNVTAYHDPDDIISEQRAAAEAERARTEAAKAELIGKKKKKSSDNEE